MAQAGSNYETKTGGRKSRWTVTLMTHILQKFSRNKNFFLGEYEDENRKYLNILISGPGWFE